jgi:ribosomal protein L20
MHGLAVARVELNRKALSNMAIEDPSAFLELIVVAGGTTDAAARSEDS